MTSHITQLPSIFQDENFDVLPKKLGADATTKCSKTVVKKGGNVLGSRRALNDITNKASINQETSSKKNLITEEEFNYAKEEINYVEEEFDFAEERFLHDHKKCIEAQQKSLEPCFLDLVFPGHDSVSPEFIDFETAKTDPDSPRCYPEPMEICVFSEWLNKPSTLWVSPPPSPPSTQWDSLIWNIEPNFVLKEDDDSWKCPLD